MSMTTATNKKSIFDGRKMWFLFGSIASAVVAVLTFTLMSAVTATESYFVLNTDVPARTQVEPSLLTEIVVAAGSTPPNALDISDITEETFTLYALQAGDILTESNAGEQVSLQEGLPSDFVVASFLASPSSAAGGNVQRGDYIDIMAVMNEPTVTGVEGFTASYLLQHVLVVDATVDLDAYEPSESATTAGGAEGEATTGAASEQIAQRSGIPTLFTVGLTQENAARLAVGTQYTLYVVLSSQDAYSGEVNETPGSATTASIWGDSAPDAGLDTDNTFGQGEAVVRPTDETVEEPSAPSAPSSPETEAPAEETTEEAPVTEETTEE